MRKDGKTRRQTEGCSKTACDRNLSGGVGWGFCKTSDLAAEAAVLLARVEENGTAVFHNKLLDGTGRLTETNQSAAQSLYACVKHCATALTTYRL